MTKHVLSALALVTFAALSLGTSKPKKASDTPDAGSTVATATPTASAQTKTSHPAVPDPEADYKSLDDIKMDGTKSVGKTGLLRVRRGDTQSDTFYAHPCDWTGGINLLKLSFTDKEQALVRAIPTSIIGDKCARVHFKITGKEYYGDIYKGKVLAILDVEAAEAKAAPEGADFGSLEDANFVGDKASGKIVETQVWRGDTNDKRFVAYPCHGGGSAWAHIYYSGDQKETVKNISSSISHCQTIRFKLTGREYYSKTWKGQLLEVK